MPGLLLRAHQLARGIVMGDHGRRRAGSGDDFWQYRPHYASESHRMIDWRQSAKTDEYYVREQEWKSAQTAQLWVDCGPSMQFSGASSRETKANQARLISLAASILLLRAGERVGLSDTTLAPRRGEQQIDRLAIRLAQSHTQDYAAPDIRGLLPHARAIFISDFMAPIKTITSALTRSADQGVSGVLLQIIDPVEAQFPFTGRTVFQSIGGELKHETLKANDLQTRYLDRLETRRTALIDLCRHTGWHYHRNLTDRPAQSALLWLYQALGEGQRAV
ncbi:MAG: DUF58 domain-containing protein [Paracoccaceae bacterium]|nr:DUF58 domain-containing protein [Paracoccaceae bacterium]